MIGAMQLSAIGMEWAGIPVNEEWNAHEWSIAALWNLGLGNEVGYLGSCTTVGKIKRHVTRVLNMGGGNV